MSEDLSGPDIAPDLQVRRLSALRKRRRRVRRLIIVLVICAVFAGIVFFSPAFSVRKVQVRGVILMDPAAVQTAAQIPMGTPLARLDGQTIAARVNQLPMVASAKVQLAWPSTARIVVTERKLLFQIAQNGGYAWVDESGTVFQNTQQQQKVPQAQLPDNADQSLRADIGTALDSLPENLLARVQSVSAVSPDSIMLQLDNQQSVFWGSAELSQQKASVLGVLMTRGGHVFNVSSPSYPTVK